MKPQIALAALCISSTCLTTALTDSALAAVNPNPSQPVVFISQPTESSVQAEKLDQWEKQLHQRLGLAEYFAKSACSSTVSRCPDADDSDVDYC